MCQTQEAVKEINPRSFVVGNSREKKDEPNKKKKKKKKKKNLILTLSKTNVI